MKVKCGRLEKEDKHFYPCECQPNCQHTIKPGEEYKVVEISGNLIIVCQECWDSFVLELKIFVETL